MGACVLRLGARGSNGGREWGLHGRGLTLHPASSALLEWFREWSVGQAAWVGRISCTGKGSAVCALLLRALWWHPGMWV